MFGVAGVTVEAVALVYLYVPLAVIENGGATLAALEDAPALIYLATRLFCTGFGFSLLLFAGFCVLIGVLILRSRLVPRAIGAMMIVAGICYVVNTVALIVSPIFFKLVNPTILLPDPAGRAVAGALAAAEGHHGRGQVTYLAWAVRGLESIGLVPHELFVSLWSRHRSEATGDP